MTADNPRVFSLVVEPVKNVLVFLVVLIASLAVAIPLPSTIPAPSKHSRLAGREGGGAGREGGGVMHLH